MKNSKYTPTDLYLAEESCRMAHRALGLRKARNAATKSDYRRAERAASNLNSYKLSIARDNTGKPAAYVNDSQEASASGEEAILASFLTDARNAGAEDDLYGAIAAAK